MTYEDALDYFASLEPRGWRLGLDRMAAFCTAAGLDDSLGKTETGPKFIHVAGTNGKGTTTAYLQSLLVEHRFRTGAFYSPYVFDPRERWQFGRDLIAPQELADLTEDLMPIAESFTETEFGGITEFEFKTAIDFAYAKRKRCEWGALEVGLGGRFDATNVITPKASVIVSIGLDHVSILGDTLAAIAGEKAGIIKPQVPVVVGSMDSEALGVIRNVAKENGSPVLEYGRDFIWEPDGSVRTPKATYKNLAPGIRGTMQGHNFACAIAAMEVAGIPLHEASVAKGAQQASAVGRFQVVRDIVLDGAHNSQAARVLAQTLAAEYPGKSVALVTNMVKGHDPADFYQELTDVASEAHIVPIDFHRAYSPKETSEAIHPLFSKVQVHESIHDGLEAAAASGLLVVVTGSFYLVGEAMRALNVQSA